MVTGNVGDVLAGQASCSWMLDGCLMQTVDPLRIVAVFVPPPGGALVHDLSLADLQVATIGAAVGAFVGEFAGDRDALSSEKTTYDSGKTCSPMVVPFSIGPLNFLFLS
jgi:hypothetical protein